MTVFALLLFSALPQAASASSKILGTAVSCSDYSTCHYSITDSKGTGSASTYGSTMYFQLPGETNVSTGHWSTTSTSSPILGTFSGIDVNSERLVKGTTNDTISRTQFCGPHGCYYKYTLVNGMIVFVLTKVDATKTTVTCNPSTYNAGGHTLCTVKVIDLANSAISPTGKVVFSLGYGVLGTFSNGGKCALSNGICSVTLHTPDEVVGGVIVDVSYAGTSAYYASSGSTEVYVNGT